MQQLLVEIQKALFDRALAFRNAHTYEPKDFDEFKAAVENGFARRYWCGRRQVRRANQGRRPKPPCAASRWSNPAEPARAFSAASPSNEMAIFGKAY